MRNWITLVLLGWLTGCANDHAIQKGCGDLSWLNRVKEEITERGRKGEVYLSNQGDEPVYIVNGCIDCTDFPTIFYDCRGKVRCQIDWTSSGNANQCTWPTAATLIWKNY